MSQAAESTPDLARDIVIRGDSLDPRHVPMLEAAAIDAVVFERQSAPVEDACRRAGLKLAPPGSVTFSNLKGLDDHRGSAAVALNEGHWPGVSRGGDVVIATATRRPWINANGYWIAYLKAFYPQRPPVLAFEPNEAAGIRPGRIVPFDTLETALIEAWVFGGNSILALERGYGDALLAGNRRALEAWKRLGAAARWLKEHAPLFRQPIVPAVTALIDKGEGGAELANLLYRHGASPEVRAANAPPLPGKTPRAVLTAAGIETPAPETAERILAHARSGATVVVDAGSERPWWRGAELRLVREQEDRAFYSLGRGRLVACKEPLFDPSAFATDVVDLITPARRLVRAWYVYSGVVLGKAAPDAGPVTGRLAMHILNYGSPIDRDAMAQVSGVYRSARFLRPEAPPMELKAVPRKGGKTEVMIPELNRLGVIVFS